VRLVKDDFGATAIDCGLIAAGISVEIIAVMNGLGRGGCFTNSKVIAR